MLDRLARGKLETLSTCAYTGSQHDQFTVSGIAPKAHATSGLPTLSSTSSHCATLIWPGWLRTAWGAGKPGARAVRMLRGTLMTQHFARKLFSTKARNYSPNHSWFY